MMLQIATDDGDSRQQMIVFPESKVVFRRSFDPGNRTRWSGAFVGDLPTWVQSYIDLPAAAPVPQRLTHGPVLIEVTPAEVAEAARPKLMRKVHNRYQRVLDAMDRTGATVNTPVRDWMDRWLTAIADDDQDYLDGQIHPSGTAKDDEEEEAPEAEATATTAAPA